MHLRSKYRYYWYKALIDACDLLRYVFVVFDLLVSTFWYESSVLILTITLKCKIDYACFLLLSLHMFRRISNTRDNLQIYEKQKEDGLFNFLFIVLFLSFKNKKLQITNNGLRTTIQSQVCSFNCKEHPPLCLLYFFI